MTNGGTVTGTEALAMSKVFDRSVAFSLAFNAPGNHRTVKADQYEVDADKSRVKMDKALIESEEFEAVLSARRKVAGWVKRRALPSLFRDGVYLVPLDLVQTIESRLESFQGDDRANIEAFMRVYPERVEEARQGLRGLFNPADYPVEEKVRASFRVSWSYVSLGTPDSLKRVSVELWEKEKAKTEQQWADAASEITSALRVGFAGLVKHLVERLTPDAAGEVKRFKGSTVENLREFLSLFDSRNIMEDGELAALVEKARAVLGFASASSIKDSRVTREKILEGFQGIQDALTPLVESAGGRRIVLEDEGEGAQ